MNFAFISCLPHMGQMKCSFSKIYVYHLVQYSFVHFWTNCILKQQKTLIHMLQETHEYILPFILSEMQSFIFALILVFVMSIKMCAFSIFETHSFCACYSSFFGFFGISFSSPSLTPPPLSLHFFIQHLSKQFVRLKSQIVGTHHRNLPNLTETPPPPQHIKLEQFSNDT